MLAMTFESGETGMKGSLAEVSNELDGPIILPSKTAGKRCCNNAKIIKGQGGGEKGKPFDANQLSEVSVTLSPLPFLFIICPSRFF